MTIDVEKLRAAQRALDEADTKLSGRIVAIEEALRGLVNVRIAAPIDAERDLVFGKLGGAWRLLVVDGPADNETPLSSCSRELRSHVLLAGCVERLLRGAGEQIDRMIEERGRALDAAAKVIAVLDAATLALYGGGGRPS